MVTPAGTVSPDRHKNKNGRYPIPPYKAGWLGLEKRKEISKGGTVRSDWCHHSSKRSICRPFAVAALLASFPRKNQHRAPGRRFRQRRECFSRCHIPIR